MLEQSGFNLAAQSIRQNASCSSKAPKLLKCILNEDKNLNCRIRHVWNFCLSQPPHTKDKERNPRHSDQGGRWQLRIFQS